MKWTIDSFPLLKEFCRRHDITFTLTYSPFAHAYKFIFKERWVFVRCFDEEQLDKLWLPGIEKELIGAIKKEFNIYDSAVEAHDAMRDAELWGKFNKPLEEKDSRRKDMVSRWTIYDFPNVRCFCDDNSILFIVDTHPDGMVEFIFDKAFKSRYTVNKYESEIFEYKWLFIFERKLIDTLKAKFNIYDKEKFYTPNFKYDSAISKPWFPYGEYNKTVKIGKDEDKMKRKESIALPIGFGNFHMVGIKKVIFNDPATIIIWNDDVKTVVKAENEPYDPEKGMAIAIAKRALGNEGNYYNIFRKWLPKKDKTSAMKETAEKLSYMMLDPKVTKDEYKEAITESIILINSFKEEKKESEVIFTGTALMPDGSIEMEGTIK